MAILLSVVIGGISIGAAYAMMAAGFSLLWQTSRTINFAQGDLASIASFALVGFALSLHLGIVLGVAGAIAASLLAGYLVRWTIVARLMDRGALALVVATIGLSLLIQNGLLVFWTSQTLLPPSVVPAGGFHLDHAVVSYQDLANIGIAAVAVSALRLFLSRTWPGRALQATAQSADTARVLGIDTAKSITLAFLLNGALVAVAAIVLAPVFLVSYGTGTQLSLSAFYAAIIGGFNRLQGALLGGLLVGLFQSFTAAYLPTEYGTGIVLGVVAVVILVKPEGLLGARELVRVSQT